MNYLVSKSTDYSLEGFKGVSHLKALDDATSESIILLNSFEEDEYKSSLIISDLYKKQGVKKFIYINSKPLSNIKVLIESLKGVVEEDEDLLKDEDEIQELVNNLEENSLEMVVSDTSVSHSGFEVMTEFLNKFAQGDESLNDPLYLEVVDRAVNSMQREIKIRDERTEMMGKGVIETYNNTSKVIRQLSDELEVLQMKLRDIENSSNNPNMKRGDSLNYYPPVLYAGSTPLVVFKEISACRYFTSMILAYMNHLQIVRKKRVRLLMVVGKQPLIKHKYESSFFELTKDNYRTGKAILETVSFTTTPLKDMMIHMTKQPDEIILVLDRTYEKEPIFKGRVKYIYGVTSRSEMILEELDSHSCITSIRTLSNTLMTIKHIPKFPAEKDNQLEVYERNFNAQFNAIDKHLGVIK